MRILISWMIIVMIFIASCGDRIEKIELAIVSPLEKYAPMMSSVPGMPLKIESNINGYGKYKYSISASGGIFLDWNSDNGKITILNKKMLMNMEDNMIYWTPMDGNSVSEKDVVLKIDLIDIETDEILTSSEYLLFENDGWYSLKEKK
ncbi:MAG: hypothetical protein JW702_08750 [Clostridiales bacterium]|nr:hypothetical protein [Clostridiales bacterium]